MHSVSVMGGNTVVIDRGPGHGEFSKVSFSRLNYMDDLLETLHAVEMKATGRLTSIMEFDILYTDSDIYECLRAIMLAFRDYHKLRRQGYRELYEQFLRRGGDVEQYVEVSDDARDWVVIVRDADRLATQEGAYVRALDELLRPAKLYDITEEDLADKFAWLRTQDSLLIRKYR
jgi:hypothetical protein